MHSSADELRAGDYFFRRQTGPVTAEQILEYAHATDDYNPIHVDEEFARGRGLPNVVSHGPRLAGIVANEVRERLGASSLSKLEMKFVAPVIAGEELIVSARIVDKPIGMPPQSLRRILRCDVTVATLDGQARAEGSLECSY